VHKSTIEIRDTVQGTEGIEGDGYGISPSQLIRRVRGSVVSSPSKVRDGAPAKNGFGAFGARMNASDDNELRTDIRPSK